MCEFNEENVTGIASVDAEHKRLFEIADEAYFRARQADWNVANQHRGELIYAAKI